MIITKKIKIILFATLTVIIVSLALIPAIQTSLKTGSQWRGVPPERVSDSLFYYAQVKQVVEGHPFIGNPYFIEHKNSISPAFFVPEWLYAIPLSLGLSLPITITLNFVLWSLLFTFLAFGVFRVLELPWGISIAGSIFVYLQSYWLILRPVSMQEVFPFFLLFFIALVLWLRDTTKTRNAVFLSLATAAPFYIYAYLWQVVVVINILTIVYLLLKKKKADIYNFIIINVVAFILVIPEFVLLYKRFLTPFYWDTMQRVGLVETHIPPLYSVYYLSWVGIILLIGLLLYFLLKKTNKQESQKICNINLPIFLVGMGLSIVMVSNVITGKELETATHIGRFVMLWLTFCFVVYWFIFVKERGAFKESSFIIKGVLVLLFLVLTIGLARNFSRSLPFVSINNNKVIDLQGYAAPLEWLNKKENTPSVIWADGLLSSYIPILTKNYVLFTGAGGLQIESSKEVAERYLVSRYFNNLSVKDLKKNYRVYAGAGNAKDKPEAYSRKIKLCNFFQLYRLGYTCGKEITGPALKGQGYFYHLEDEYKEIQSHINVELKKFKVAYIIKDKENDPQFHPEDIKGTTLIYNDGRFLIYKIK